MVKKFVKHDLDLMNELVGKKFMDIFKQLEMFIINFGEGLNTRCIHILFVELNQMIMCF